MSRYYGISPKPATRQAVETFEEEVMIRRDNRFLISSVYLDMQEERWAVAMAYNPSRNLGLHGHDNLLEVRYSYSQKDAGVVTMLRSDPIEETLIRAGPFTDPDAFAQYAIGYEREILNRLA